MADGPHNPITLDVIPGANPFPQTGAWSMVDLSTAPIKGTLGALSRYSAARVDAYAAIVGETLCSIFHLSWNGRRNIDAAVESLKVVGTMGKALEIGFAIEDIVRVMARTDEGRICVALCAALKECYSEDMAVEVLLEMARSVKVDAKYMPSSQAWKELLRACAGTLSASTFPLLAEHYMRLPKDDRKLGAYHRYEHSSDSLRSCSNPKAIAKAMIILAQITRGDMRAVTFIGGNDTGWLAAVAQWFFDLRLVIFLEEEESGQLCHRDCDTIFHQTCDPDDAQVRIIFQRKTEKHKQSVTAVDRTFVIDDISKLFEREDRGPDALMVSGRLPWKTALSLSFAPDFERLKDLRESFGGAIGSAARLFKGLVQADEFFPLRFRTACTSYNDASYGQGFVQNTLHWFPELVQLKRPMQEAAATTMDKARRQYEACISTIREKCACTTCKSTATGHIVIDDDQIDDEVEMTPAPEFNEDEEGIELDENDDEESIPGWDPDHYCLVVLVETIICLSRTLSNVALEEKALLPVRSGFELAYGKQLNQRQSAPGGQRALKEIGQIAFCLDFDIDFSFGPSTESDYALDGRMKSILSLFCGHDISFTSGHYSIICANGISVFLGFLRHAGNNKETVSRIHVIPGHVTHEGKSYTKMIDRVLLQPPAVDLTKVIGITSVRSSDWKESLSVQESSNALECLLEITHGDDDGDEEYSVPIRVGPAHLVAELSGRFGLVTCQLTNQQSNSRRLKVCAETNLFKGQDVQKAISAKKALSHNGISIYILDCRNLDSVNPAVACTACLPPEYTVYFVKQECMNCCIKTALSVDRPERRDFCFLIFAS